MTTTTTTMRCAIYVRVSLDKGQDTENQLSQLREYAARQRWSIVDIYEDHVFR
jgi:DNA invertase Pin-like site-specific DNA recombinase